MNPILEYIAFGIYVLAGPAMGVLFGITLIKGRKRMTLISRPTTPLPASPPRVSIIIPAKDEAERIGDCLRSALDQDYPDFDVITVDDRSSDGTGEVMDGLAQTADGLSVIHIACGNPPEGWTGKCRALHTAVGEATGKWLLFIDSDVVLRPNALSATMAFALHRDVDLMSLLPRQDCPSFWENLLVPFAGCALGAMHLVALTNNDHVRGVSFANGQYMLFRRGVYEAVGEHEAVRDQLCEDIAFARLVKGGGYRVRIALGTDLAAVRMYDSLAAIGRGWSRIFFAAGLGRPWRMLMATAFMVFCCYSGYAAVGWGIYRCFHPVNMFGGWGWMGAAAVHLGLLTALLGAMYSWTGNRWRNALLLPLAGVMLMWIFAKSMGTCMTGKVEWRGTRYAHRQRVLVPE